MDTSIGTSADETIGGTAPFLRSHQLNPDAIEAVILEDRDELREVDIRVEDFSTP